MQKWIVRLIGIGAVLGILAVVAVLRWPNLGAQIADPLRAVFGNEAVAQLETVLFTAEDRVKQLTYQEEDVVAPAWAMVDTVTATVTSPPPTNTPKPTASNTPPPSTTPTPTIPATATMLPTPEATVTPTPWQPQPLTPFGELAGEGVWSPYLTTANGDVVAYRTFLQPDAERPFALAAIVAFDLSQTQLHYKIGTKEPGGDNGQYGNGSIPTQHKQADILLATFNGGFKATHGNYGAMSDGIEALPPQDGLGTIAIYADGTVRIGNWGTDITTSPDLIAWRQNAHLVVQAGAITDLAQTDSEYHWGGSINGAVVTWRSGIGISADGQTLYYFAGDSLSMPVLGQTMLTAGAEAGILLDINAYWVHFAAIETAEDGTTLLAQPLFPEEMNIHADRYLRNQNERDFFYVTTP